MNTRPRTGLLPAALAFVALTAPAGRAAPAFLDAGDRVDIRMASPVAAGGLVGHVTVSVGNVVIPVSRVEAVTDPNASAPVDPNEVVLAGTLQAALGGTAWQTDGTQTRMRPVGGDRFALVVRLPRGRYEYKVVRGGTWAENYGQGFAPGGVNLSLTVPHDTLVRFEVDFAHKTVRDSVDDPAQVPPPSALLPTAALPAGPPLSRDLCLRLARPIGPAQIARPISVRFDDGTTRAVVARDVLSGPAYFYARGDLGAAYTPTRTAFRVWSPVASAGSVLLYRAASGAAYKEIPMRRGPAGTWAASVPGDLDGVYYQYRLTSYGVRRTTPDICCRAASADLRRSLVVDLARTDPPGWASVAPPRLRRPTDAVVYELHVRDFTSDPVGGVPAALRGKYLGLVVPGTHPPGSPRPTGLDYLRWLGVTHVHLLPIQSINPGHAGGYNWGYETDLFDVPEPRYATDPADPAGVIRQVKAMVAGLHRAHLGVVLDVVYNHTVPVSGDASPFWATVPYYYFRTDFGGSLLNESGVGNALDDDHPMVRRYVLDSLLYWARQYRVDGFRFDLLGMFTPQTVRQLAAALHRQRPDLLLYGEPWTGGGPTRFGKGAQRGAGVAVFNDNFRAVVRGDLNGTLAGFALGGSAAPEALRTALAGSPDFAASPGESMNYVSIHDDMTLLDKVEKALPQADAVTDQRALKLAGAMVLLSQGVPILEGGAEMGRTKGGSRNSYDLGDAVNRFDWARGRSFQPVADYYRGLIAVRRAHPAFRCATAAAVRETLAFVPPGRLPPKTVAFTLDGAPTGDRWPRTLVVFHGAAEAAPLALPPGRWRVAVDGDRAGLRGAPPVGRALSLAPLSAYVFYQDDGP